MDGLTNEERVEAWLSCWDKSIAGMAILREDGQFQSVNQQWVKILGVPASEFYGNTFQDITASKDLKEDLEQAKLIVEGKIDSYEMDKSYCFANGKTVHVRLLVVRMPTDTSKPFMRYLSRIVTIHPAKKKSGLNTLPLKELDVLISFIQKHWKWLAVCGAAVAGAIPKIFPLLKLPL